MLKTTITKIFYKAMESFINLDIILFLHSVANDTHDLY